MKVKDLIDILSQVDPELDVSLPFVKHDCYYDDVCGIELARLNEDGEQVFLEDIEDIEELDYVKNNSKDTIRIY